MLIIFPLQHNPRVSDSFTATELRETSWTSSFSQICLVRTRKHFRRKQKWHCRVSQPVLEEDWAVPPVHAVRLVGLESRKYGDGEIYSRVTHLTTLLFTAAMERDCSSYRLHNSSYKQSWSKKGNGKKKESHDFKKMPIRKNAKEKNQAQW